MKSKATVIALSAAAGAFVWVVDSVYDTLFLDKGPLLRVMVTDPPPPDMIERLLVLAVIMGLGAAISGLLKEPKKATEEAEREVPSQVSPDVFAQAAGVMILGLDPQGRITFFNEKCEELTGYRRAAVVGGSFYDLFVPVRALPRALPMVEAVVERGETVDAELPWQTADHREVVVAMHVSPVRENGEIVGAVSIGEEITEFRLSDVELALTAEPFRPLAEDMLGDGMAAADNEGRLTWVNDALAKMLGRSAEELIGTRLADFVDPDGAADLQAAQERACEDEDTIQLEVQVQGANGRFPAAVALRPIEAPGGETVGTFALVRDLSEIKQRELALIDERASAQAEASTLAERIRELEARVKTEREAARKEFAAEIERLEALLESADERVAEARRTALAEQQSRIDELEAALSRAEERVRRAREEALAEQQSRIDDLEKQLAVAEARVEEARAEALASQQAKIDALQEDLAEAERRIESVRRETLAEQQEVIDGLRAQLSDAERRVEQAREEALAEQQSRIDELEEHLAAAEARVEEARAEALASQQGKIDALQEDLAEAEGRIESVRRETLAEEQEIIDGLRVQLSDAERRVEQAREEALAEQQSRIDELEEHLAAAEARVEEARAEALDSQQGKIEGLEQQLEAAEANHAAELEEIRSEAAASLAELNRRLEEARERTEEVRRQTLAEQQDRIDELTSALSHAEQRIAEAREDALAEQQGEIDRLQRELSEARAQIEQARQEARAEQQSRIEELERQVAEADERVEETRQTALAGQQVRIDDLEAELEEIERRHETEIQQLQADHQAAIAKLQSRLAESEARVEAVRQETFEAQQSIIDGLREELVETEERVERVRQETFDEQQAIIDRLRDELREAQERIEEARREALAQQQVRIDALEDELAQADERVERAREEALAEQQGRIDALEAQLVDVEQRIEQARRQERQKAREDYEAEVARSLRIAEEAERKLEDARAAVRGEFQEEIDSLSEQLARADARAEAARQEVAEEYRRTIEDLEDRLDEAMRRAEQVAAKARDEYMAVFDSMSEMVLLQDAQGRVLFVNEAAAQALGDGAEELPGRDILDVWRSLGADFERSPGMEAVASGASASAEFSDHEGRTLVVEADPLRGQDGEVTGAIELALDVTECRGTRNQMAESLEFVRALLDGIPYPVFLIDRIGRFQACNQTLAARVLGIPRDDVVGATIEDLTDLPEDLAEGLSRRNETVVAEGSEEAYEATITCADGERRTYAFRKEPFRDEDDRIVGVIGAMLDVSGLQRAQEELRREREQAAELFARTPVVIAEIRPDGTTAAVYGASEEVLGYRAEELEGQNWWRTLFPGELYDQTRDVLGTLRGGGDLKDEALVIHHGTEGPRTVSWTTEISYEDNELLGILAVGYDINERAEYEQSLERRLREAIEQVKKTRCLSNVLRLAEDDDLTLVEMISGIVAGLPPAWRYPGITTARITVYDRTREAGESRQPVVASQSADIIVNSEVVGKVEVRYHEERPELSEGPFTADERQLLELIAQRIGDTIERRSAEDSLMKLQQFHHALIDQANEWLMALDRQGNVVQWNRTAEQISGYERGEVVGDDRVFELLYPDPEYRREIGMTFQRILSGAHEACEWETKVQCKDGTRRVISWNARRLISEDDGSTIGAVALGRDLSAED